VEIFAGQKLRQAQLPLYCRNIWWNGGINFANAVKVAIPSEQLLTEEFSSMRAGGEIGKISPSENFHVLCWLAVGCWPYSRREYLLH
jgi:hypothetical protein